MNVKKIEEYRTALKHIEEINGKDPIQIDYRTDIEVVEDALEYATKKKYEEYNKAVKKANNKSKRTATLNILKYMTKK